MNVEDTERLRGYVTSALRSRYSGVGMQVKTERIHNQNALLVRCELPGKRPVIARVEPDDVAERDLEALQPLFDDLDERLGRTAPALEPGTE